MDEGNSTYPTLWGEDLYLVPRTRGRPKFQWTLENANKIRMLLAFGWSNKRIAYCILDPRTGKPISIPTLKRYFRAELKVRDQSRDHLRAKMLMSIAESAFAGNVGAMRLLDKLIEKNDMMAAAKRLVDVGIEDDDKMPVGKKARAIQKAGEVIDGKASAGWGNDLDPTKIN